MSAHLIISSVWKAEIYQSGAQLVTTSPKRPHYSISPIPSDDFTGIDDFSDIRREITNSLCAWLNGGEVPVWMLTLKRIGPETVMLFNGCKIHILGPMVPKYKEERRPSGDWKTRGESWKTENKAKAVGYESNPSTDSQIDRGLFTDALIKAIPPRV